MILGDERHRFVLLHAEGALRWRPGSRALLAAQLAHLVAVSLRANVRVGVLPYDIDAPAPYESRFALYDDWDDGSPPLVETEHTLGELLSTRPSVVQRYVDRFQSLEAVALFGDDARAFIERVRVEVSRA